MRIALLASAILIAAAPSAFAQTSTNDQYTLRGSTSQTSVSVGHAGDVGATAVASGNALATAGSDVDASLDNTQHMDGDVNAGADVVVWRADGTVAIASAAIANAATATTQAGNLDIRSTQLAHGDANASTTFSGGDASDASTSASASGNVGAVSATDGQVRLIATQEATGAVSAITQSDHCCVANQVVSDAIASANNISAAGDTATMLTDTTQTSNGERVQARVDLYTGYATDAVANATANGNAVTVDNQWGYTNTRSTQQSASAISADSYVTLGGDFEGFASAGAYGVGNSTIVANVGSDTALDVTQDNSGAISANAALAGDGGGAALASSAAYGNVTTGSLCANCDGAELTMTANNNQTNGGDIYSSAHVATQNADMVAATASAIGNAATFQVRAPGG